MFIPLRDENPTRRVPIFTLLLIAVNVVVFAVQVFSPLSLPYYVLRMGTIPYEITHFTTVQGLPVERISPVLALVVSMFLHGSLLHLLGNMLYLWIFGNNVEDFLGPVRFVLFYLVCGVFAGATQVFSDPLSTTPMIGASGAIAGILGAYLLLFPTARIHTLVFIIIILKIVRIPAVIILVFWFLVQLLNVRAGGDAGVAFFAHIGGFISGLILVKIFQPRGARRKWA